MTRPASARELPSRPARGGPTGKGGAVIEVDLAVSCVVRIGGRAGNDAARRAASRRIEIKIVERLLAIYPMIVPELARGRSVERVERGPAGPGRGERAVVRLVKPPADGKGGPR